MPIGTGTFSTTPKMTDNLNAVMKSGRLSYGPLSEKFEAEFSRLHNARYAVLSNSGTSSLLVALQTLKELNDWQTGDEVIVPALTFVATVNVVLQLGLKPVLVDVEPDYYGIDVSRIEGAITDRTRCIMPVHTFGQQCDMIGLKDAVEDTDIKVIEDSCEAMFVTQQGNHIGALGDIACFSTYVAHIITTGVGGIATTNNELYAKVMRSLVNHGLRYDELSDDSGFNPYKNTRDFVFDRVGHSFRITELEAAIGLAQLEEWHSIIARRRYNAARLSGGLCFLGEFLQLPKPRPHTDHAFMMYPFVCKKPGTRDGLRRHLDEAGIGTRLMLPLTNQPVYEGLFDERDYPVAQWINENGYYIGCHQDITEDDLDYMIAAHRDFFDESR